VEGLFNWLTSLPVAALYLAIGVAAAIENVFPPLPSDVIVAIGAFIAARGHGTALGAFLATWIGNVGGAAVMYYVGRRFGADRLDKRMLGERSGAAEARVQALYGKYGLVALFLSRFLPGVRAIVPPFAGALRIPFVRALAPMALASAIWYGAISYLGFSVGADWHRLSARIQQYGRIMAIAAAVIVGLGALVWWFRSRRTRERD
jgi:membrane protein DedA with SNARE-associated domain